MSLINRFRKQHPTWKTSSRGALFSMLGETTNNILAKSAHLY